MTQVWWLRQLLPHFSQWVEDRSILTH